MPDTVGRHQFQGHDMTEPTTSAALASTAVAGTFTAGLLGMLAGLNGEAATGALFGSLIYFTTTHELNLTKRVLFFITSFVMGYLFSPAIVDFEAFGIRPFAFPGPAAFGASLLVVSISLAAIRARGSPSTEKGSD